MIGLKTIGELRGDHLEDEIRAFTEHFLQQKKSTLTADTESWRVLRMFTVLLDGND